MENNLVQIMESIPNLIKNTRFTVSLQGWPAALAVVALCGSCVAIYAIWSQCSQPAYVVGDGYCNA